MNLDEMLGFDADNPDHRQGEILVDEHRKMLERLIAVRKANELDQEDVAAIMGIDKSGVSKIESGSRDLHLSTLRRYAFACGAVIWHDVESFKAVWSRERSAKFDVDEAEAWTWESSLTAAMPSAVRR